jgi:alkanesulfonate monooxygenase SsuD/methylene tetrahydromethanopterin reductase-like flavin-dependent oxidoreductase (luciferase family)
MTTTASTLEVGVTFRLEHTPTGLLGLMQQAEDGGFAEGWVFDNHVAAMEPYVLLGMVGAATSRIRLGTCVTNPSSRHPTVTASALSTLDAVTSGRVQLGIGRGDSAVRLIGDRPASIAALEQSIADIRSLTAGGTADFNGTPVSLPWATPRDIPVWVAGYGPAVLDLAARVADGVILQIGDPEIVSFMVSYVRQRERAAGRPPGTCRVMVAVPAHVGHVDDGVAHTGWYPKFLRHHFEVAARRWADAAPGLADAYLTDGNGEVDRNLVVRSCFVGPPDDHLERIEELRRLGVDNVNLYLVDSRHGETIRAYAEAVLPQVPGLLPAGAAR